MRSLLEMLKSAGKSDEKKYGREKEIALLGSASKRLSLARKASTHKEILFYLAEHDPDPKIRRAVAKNKSTPLHASAMLAIDVNEDVRLELAGRLVKLLPDLSTDKQSQLYAYAVQALGTLALDEVLKIRKALSSTLKDHAHAPPKVAAQLARDLEREVSEPILRFCTALSDKDLIKVLAEHPAMWASEAVAVRSKISAPVSRAVIDLGHSKAGVLLLGNKGADVTTALLQVIIDRAKEFPEWHEPLVTHRHLPPKMARQLSRYVDARIRKLLVDKGAYDLQTTEIVTDATRRRIHIEEEINSSQSVDKSGNAARRVNKLLKEGRLNEEVISDFLAMRDVEFIIAALTCLTGGRRSDIARAFSMRTPKLICAVCWKAGLSMRFALRVQQEIGYVAAKDLIYPRGGTDYPFKPEDMAWQLKFLGLDDKSGKKN